MELFFWSFVSTFCKKQPKVKDICSSLFSCSNPISEKILVDKLQAVIRLIYLIFCMDIFCMPSHSQTCLNLPGVPLDSLWGNPR